MLLQVKPPGLIKPSVVILGTLGIFAYGMIAMISRDSLWFLSRAEVPDPQRIVIRVNGAETTLTPAAPDYTPLLQAAREALSAFKNWAPGSMGLSPATLDEYQQQGTILELYFSEPVNFRLPFNDGRPTALLIPVRGRYGGEGNVFRGKRDKWWAGQLMMNDPRPIEDVLTALGYIQ